MYLVLDYLAEEKYLGKPDVTISENYLGKSYENFKYMKEKLLKNFKNPS